MILYLRSVAAARGRCSAAAEDSARDNVAIQLRASSSAKQERQWLRALESSSPAAGALAALVQQLSVRVCLTDDSLVTLWSSF